MRRKPLTAESWICREVLSLSPEWKSEELFRVIHNAIHNYQKTQLARDCLTVDAYIMAASVLLRELWRKSAGG
jgi:hypothetical protein